MHPIRNRSFTRRTLLIVAGSVAAIVLAATGVSYYAVFDAMEVMGQQLLSQYAEERAKREAAPFLQAEANHRVLREAFVKRWSEAPDPRFRERFDAHFARTSDGAMRSRRELVDPTRQSNTWIHAKTPITPELQRLIMLSHDLCEQFFPAWQPQLPALYVSSPLEFNSGIAPQLPEWVWQIPADFDQQEHEWEQVATVENNPSRKSVWTGVVPDASATDPAQALKFTTLCTPVDLDGRHLLTLHHDILLESLLTVALRSERAGITHVIFREDGRLIVHPDKTGELDVIIGNILIQESSDEDLKRLYAAVVGSKNTASPITGYDKASDRYFAASRLRGPEWFFVTLMPRAELRRDAFRSAQWVLWSGLASLAFALAALAFILRREIAQPVQNLVAASRRMAAGEAVGVLPVERADEFGELASSFNEMTQRVTERDLELRSLNQNLEQRIERRTLELRESEARLRTLLQHSPVAIVTVDADSGLFVDCNEGALQLLGIDWQQSLAVGPAEMSPPFQPDGRASATAARTWIDGALQGSPAVFEWIHRTPDGHEKPCEVHLARLPASGRRLVVGTLVDVTLRKQAEAELLRALARERELGQLKSEFVSMVSHEFRTPLEVILSSSEILDRYFDRLDPEKRRAQLGSIRQSVLHMAKMMESVLLLSRVEAGTVSYLPASLDLDKWCRRLIDEIESATCHVCPITLELDPASTSGASGDGILLRHIFGNLLSNAIKYSAPGSSVRLVIERDGTQAVCRVIDRGRGILEADRVRLFRAFYRGRNVGEVAGTGLGLVIVKRCVDLHGGRIRCESREGEGSTFVVTLPLFGGLPIQADTADDVVVLQSGRRVTASFSPFTTPNYPSA